MGLSITAAQSFSSTPQKELSSLLSEIRKMELAFMALIMANLEKDIQQVQREEASFEKSQFIDAFPAQSTAISTSGTT